MGLIPNVLEQDDQLPTVLVLPEMSKKLLNYQFLARLYESTGRAIAVTPASASASALASALASASALLKMLKFLVKVFIRLYLLNMLMD